MASTRIFEQDHGTYMGHFAHHHNGYYAGDFRTTRQPIAVDLPTADRGLASAADAPSPR